MIKQSLISAALALAAATLAAQAPKPTSPTTPTGAAPKPATAAAQPAASQPANAQNRYVPAIMQEKITVTGCVKQGADWELTDATRAGQQGKTTYKLEGLSGARLSLFVGKRVEAAGALQVDGKTTGKSLPRFEATAVKETTGSCS
ncbi:MAG TPA: hypothetical protein VGJ39_13540 [Vicinamibacterales bacterium]|jgi:hypothetical protein